MAHALAEPTGTTPRQAHSLTVQELASRVSGAVEGDGGALIRGVSTIEEAELGDIVFAEDSRFLSQAARSRASAIVAFLEATTPDKPLIKVENPRYAFARILELFVPPLNAPAGVHPTAVVGRDPRFGQGVSVGPSVVIGDDVRLGDGAAILAGSVVGDRCEIGPGCVLHANVTLYAGCVLGRHVAIHSGTAVGSDGFGYMRIGDRSYKVPHVGNVVIGDDVEIGANCTVDRAKTGSTVVGARSKIDNLVHVAHNVKIGTDCIVVAQVGVAGSCQLGDRVMIAGQAGIKDHVTIGDGALVLAQAGVFGDIAAGEQVSGYPARPHRERLRMDAAVANLPDYVKRLRALEKTAARLAERNEELERQVADLCRVAGVADAT